MTDVNNRRAHGGQRNTYIDSTKGALILFVVFGHMLEIFISDPIYRAVYSAIYLFHMPLFVMTAGMFSKAHLGNKDYAGILTRLVVPLILFQCLYLAPAAIKSGHLDMLSLQPYWILWFLLALIFWKLMLPQFARLPFPVPIAVLIALAAGFSNTIGYALSLSRTLYFFPFFLIGFLHKDRIIACSARHRGALALSFVGTMSAVMYWSFNGLPYQALWGSMSYAQAPAVHGFPAGGRLLVLLLSFLGAVAVLAIIKESRVLAYFGERSLAVYLLHGFVIRILAFAAAKFAIPSGPYLLPVWLGLAVLVAVCLAPLDRWLLRLYERMSAVVVAVVGVVGRRVRVL